MIQIDMEKPNHCLHCPMCNGNDDCMLIQEVDTSWDWDEQYANCPLQEVKPHGRLIDADKLMTVFKGISEAETQIYGHGNWNFVGKCINEIEHAPTVLEAEVEE